MNGKIMAVSSPLRRTAAVLLATSLFGLWARNANAQACHGAPLSTGEQTVMRNSVDASFATYRSAHYSGEYQGVRATLAVQQPRYAVSLSVPAYRLVRNDSTIFGAGDLAADVRVPLFIASDADQKAGLEAAASFPTGSSENGLGMGHVMVMPGVFWDMRHDALHAILQVGYGRVLAQGSGAHGHHHGQAPLVDPMNSSELEHALGLGYEVGTHTQLALRSFGAVPIAAPGGASREVVAAGINFIGSLLVAGVELQVPVVGEPFTLKSVLSLAVQM